MSVTAGAIITFSVADPKGALVTQAPSRSSLVLSHAVFSKKFANNRLSTPPLGLAPPYEILDPPLVTDNVNKLELITCYMVSKKIKAMARQ